jgi:hypothetical protein
MPLQLFVNQFKDIDVDEEAQRRKMFIERMERKLAFKETLRRHLYRNKFPRLR